VCSVLDIEPTLSPTRVKWVRRLLVGKMQSVRASGGDFEHHPIGNNGLAVGEKDAHQTRECWNCCRVSSTWA
jgi:hypothetical protein